MELEYKFKTSEKLESPDKELGTYKTMCQKVQTGVSDVILMIELLSSVVVQLLVKTA